VLIYNYLFCN